MRQKTSSQERPENPFIIENKKNGNCTILFFDDIEEYEVIDEDGTASMNYRYNLYVMENVAYRDNLADTIQNNLVAWLNDAKEQDRKKVAKEVRTKRDKLLSDTDWTQVKDSVLSKKEQSNYATYRQKLRDIPQQEGFPYDVKFPILGE